MHILRGSTRDLSLGRQVVLPKRQRPRLQGLSAPLRFFFKAFLHDSIAVWMCFYLYTRSILLMYLYFSFWVSCICLLSMGYVSSESLDAKTYKEKLSCKNIWLYVYWLCSKWRIIYVFFFLKSEQILWILILLLMSRTRTSLKIFFLCIMICCHIHYSHLTLMIYNLNMVELWRSKRVGKVTSFVMLFVFSMLIIIYKLHAITSFDSMF